MKGHLDHIQDKIQKVDELVKKLSVPRQSGHKVVFTNGCFDILHLGHVTYLAKAADMGDVLVLGLNSDSSVKRQGKGDDRPVNNEQSRAFLLASLGFIDYIVVFDDDTPLHLIEKLTPDILVKGGDYDPNVSNPNDPKYIVGSDIVKKNNGEVRVIDLVDGFSTTSILQKIRS